MDKFFERVCIIAIIIILTTIAWAMWKPVTNTQQIIKALQQLNIMVQRHEQDIGLLKKDIIQKVP